MRKSQADATTARNLEEKFNRDEDVLDYFDVRQACVDRSAIQKVDFQNKVSYPVKRTMAFVFIRRYPSSRFAQIQQELNYETRNSGGLVKLWATNQSDRKPARRLAVSETSGEINPCSSVAEIKRLLRCWLRFRRGCLSFTWPFAETLHAAPLRTAVVFCAHPVGASASPLFGRGVR